MARQSKFGFFAPNVSRETTVQADPTVGFDSRSAAEVEKPGSMLSGQNCWVLDNDLQPRYRLRKVASNNPFGDVVCGTVPYDSLTGARYQFTASAQTVAYLNGGSWATLTLDSGHTAFTGTETDDIFGTVVYLPRNDENVAVFTNGVDQPLICGDPSSSHTVLSNLTQGPIATDVALVNNRLVFWNVRATSDVTRYTTRAQWTVRGDPEDETTLGSGSQDLVDMRGEGTRIFSLDDQLVLGSTHEIWTGRSVGDPFIFDFQPLVRTQGIPYKRAAIRCPLGIVWLGDDYMVYLLESSHVQPRPIGGTIQPTLRATLGDFGTAHFGWNASLRQLTLYYATTAGTYPTRAFTYHLNYDAWTPQTFVQAVSYTGTGTVPSSATTWGGLLGTLSSQLLTYNQLLGLSGEADTEIAYSSTGTAYSYSTSATSDDGQTVLHEALLQLAPSSERYWQMGQVRTMLAADSASTLSIGVSGDGGLTVPYEQRFSISANSQATTTPLFCNVVGSTIQVRLRDDTGGFWKVPKLIGRGTIRGPVV